MCWGGGVHMMKFEQVCDCVCAGVVVCAGCVFVCVCTCDEVRASI